MRAKKSNPTLLTGLKPLARYKSAFFSMQLLVPERADQLLTPGVVVSIAKKLCKRATSRTLLKRLCKVHAAGLPPALLAQHLVFLRLHQKIDAKTFVSAQSGVLKQAMHQDLTALLNKCRGDAP